VSTCDIIKQCTYDNTCVIEFAIGIVFVFVFDNMYVRANNCNICNPRTNVLGHWTGGGKYFATCNLCGNGRWQYICHHVLITRPFDDNIRCVNMSTRCSQVCGYIFDI